MLWARYCLVVIHFPHSVLYFIDNASVCFSVNGFFEIRDLIAFQLQVVYSVTTQNIAMSSFELTQWFANCIALYVTSKRQIM